jgi:ATP-dependent Clp protease ATP-binding subunit ClpB
MLFSLQEAERRMDLARVADIKYGALLEVDAAIAKLEGETGENLILTETVGPEQIAEVRLLEAKLVALPFSSSMCITVSLY